MAKGSDDLEIWREPPIYRLLSSAIHLDGNHLNKVWRGLVHREGSTEAGIPMIIKWMPSDVRLITELACAMAAQALKLPVPSGVLVLCPADQLPRLPVKAGTGVKVCFGSHLQFEDRSPAHLDTGNAEIAEYVWRRLCETGTASPGGAWDELLANEDRHHENVLFDGNRWWLFDHERALEPLAKVMERFAQQIVRQRLANYQATKNTLAQELTQRRPEDHGLTAQPDALMQRRVRLRWLADVVRHWHTGNAVLDGLFPICEVVLRSIDVRLPTLALHLQSRLRNPTSASLWDNPSTKSKKSPRRSPRPLA